MKTCVPEEIPIHEMIFPTGHETICVMIPAIAHEMIFKMIPASDRENFVTPVNLATRIAIKTVATATTTVVTDNQNKNTRKTLLVYIH